MEPGRGARGDVASRGQTVCWCPGRYPKGLPEESGNQSAGDLTEDHPLEYASFGNIPAWNYVIARTVQTSPGQAGVGATYRQTCTIPRRSEESFEVTAFAPPSRLAVTGRIGPLHASCSHA